MSYEIKYDALTPVENDDIPNIIDEFLSNINGDTLISEIPKIFFCVASDYKNNLIEKEMSDYIKDNYPNFNRYKTSEILKECERLDNIYDFSWIIYNQGLEQVIDDMKEAYCEDIIKDIASCCIKDISIDEFIEDIEDNIREITLSPKISPKELRETYKFDFKKLEEWYSSQVGENLTYRNVDLIDICDYFFDALVFELFEIAIKIHGKK
ncbi:MAG: hypothetical protein IJ414_01210 [Campylobacter sp.]|uniref:hypothetical protein n=1 Tax=Campylobacter sp. TaxID=205 RepID=UPI00259CBD80|nr:hypothetical protein [Campylobacter sp.]MBQ8608748.1 hypothetical protein [Campylobacter sp.]